MVDVFVMATARMVGRGEKVVSPLYGGRQRWIDCARGRVIKNPLKTISTEEKRLGEAISS
jgi:hypothetical protein